MTNHQFFGIDKPQISSNLCHDFHSAPGALGRRAAKATLGFGGGRQQEGRSSGAKRHRHRHALGPCCMCFFLVKFKTSSCHERSILYLLNMHITIQFCIHLPALQINTLQALQQSDLAMENPLFMDDFSIYKL